MNADRIQITTEQELTSLLAANVPVYVEHTGPFGEDENAKVVAFGNVGDTDVNSKIVLDVDDFGEDVDFTNDDADLYETFFTNYKGTPVVVVSKSIGQSVNNFFMLDAYSLGDCGLYVNEDDLIDATDDVGRCLWIPNEENGGQWIWDYLAAEDLPEVQLTTEEELAKCMELKITVLAKHTGPFGEDEGAEVIYFGDVNTDEARGCIEVDSETLEEMEYEDTDTFCRNFAGTNVVILDTAIGQSSSNCTLLDGYTIEDCELFISGKDAAKLGFQASDINNPELTECNRNLKEAKRGLRSSEGSQANWTLICDDGKYCAWMDPKNISEMESAVTSRIQDICKLDVSQIGYGDCTISFRDLTKDQAEDILSMFLHGADYFEDIDVDPKAFEKCKYSMFRSR